MPSLVKQRSDGIFVGFGRMCVKVPNVERTIWICLLVKLYIIIDNSILRWSSSTVDDVQTNQHERIYDVKLSRGAEKKKRDPIAASESGGSRRKEKNERKICFMTTACLHCCAASLNNSALDSLQLCWFANCTILQLELFFFSFFRFHRADGTLKSYLANGFSSTT